MANIIKATPQKRGRFLSVVKETGNVSKAARATGITRRHWYVIRAEDSDFASEWDHARETYAEEVLEVEADRRAVEGFHWRTVFDKDGNPIGEERRYSDTLLIFRLKALKPDTYRESSSVELKHSGTIKHEHSLDSRLARAEQELEAHRNGNGHAITVTS